MKLLPTVAAIAMLLASVGASAAPTEERPVETKLTLKLGGQARVLQDNRLVLHLTPDGTLEGLGRNGAPGDAKLASDGTLSWDGQALLRITQDKLVDLANNRSLSIHTIQDATRTVIVASNFKFELGADGTVVFNNGEKEDRSIRIEGDPASRRTAFVVLVHAAVFMKVQSLAQPAPSRATSA